MFCLIAKVYEIKEKIRISTCVFYGNVNQQRNMLKMEK